MTRSCPRCGKVYPATAGQRVCGACRRPYVRIVRLVSKILTPRQRQLVSLVAEGHPNKEIACRLHLSEGTIKTYMGTVFRKTGATNRTELAVMELRRKYEGTA